MTPSSASTSLYGPSTGGAADIIVGAHLFSYVSVQGDYVWNRNGVVLISNSTTPTGVNFYRLPQTVTQNAVLANVLLYFRKRGCRIRPYLSEGTGAVFIGSRLSGLPIVEGMPNLPRTSSSHTSIALRTSVGIDIGLPHSWNFRYSFGETITRNTYGDQLTPPASGIPKNFQNLFGIYFQL